MTSVHREPRLAPAFPGHPDAGREYLRPAAYGRFAARYNTATIDLADQTGAEPDLNASHSYHRLNPSIGVTYTPIARTTFYAAYNEGLRAPNPAELTCANPAVPCKLPTNFLSDPDLKPVVAKNWGFGSRFGLGHGWYASANAFRTDLLDDIRFVSASALGNTGYFVNVGRTRRQGVELGLDADLVPVRVSLRYSYVDATFQSAFDESSPNNSAADANGDIHVGAGNRIPGIPRHTLRLRLDYEARPGFGIGATLIGSSSQYVRGDENNADAGGTLAGYAALNLDATYKLTPAWTLFAKVDNVFDKAYTNFGLLSLNQFVGPGRSFVSEDNGVKEQFVSPGSARGFWIGLRYRLR